MSAAGPALFPVAEKLDDVDRQGRRLRARYELLRRRADDVLPGLSPAPADDLERLPAAVTAAQRLVVTRVGEHVVPAALATELLAELRGLDEDLHRFAMTRRTTRIAACRAVLGDVRARLVAPSAATPLGPGDAERLGFRSLVVLGRDGGRWVEWARSGVAEERLPPGGATDDGAATAPVVVDGRHVGVVRAEPRGASAPDVLDREILQAFAAGFGRMYASVLPTVTMRRQRDLVRAAMEAAYGGLSRDGDDLTGWGAPGPAGPDVSTASAAPDPADEWGSGAPGRDELEGLTQRQREVFRLMVGGATNGEIASALQITEGTVKSHVKRILRRLRARNRAHAISRFFDDAPDA